MSRISPGDQDLWQTVQEHVERPKPCHFRSAVPTLEELLELSWLRTHPVRPSNHLWTLKDGELKAEK